MVSIGDRGSESRRVLAAIVGTGSGGRFGGQQLFRLRGWQVAPFVALLRRHALDPQVFGSRICAAWTGGGRSVFGSSQPFEAALERDRTRGGGTTAAWPGAPAASGLTRPAAL